ncbi:Mov34/MPN/PAD-1 family protein [bacterium]|nr:Mov34/MPN/PAD-1 family protein [bacterium]
MIKLNILKEVFDEVVVYGDNSPNYEVCGAFLGKRDESSIDNWLCDEFIPMTNVSTMDQGVHYVPDPNEMFQMLSRTTHMDKDADKDLIGIFHTHPHNLPIPSQTDLNGAGYRGFYMIHSPKFEETQTYFYDGGDPVFNKTTINILKEETVE